MKSSEKKSDSRLDRAVLALVFAALLTGYGLAIAGQSRAIPPTVTIERFTAVWPPTE